MAVFRGVRSTLRSKEVLQRAFQPLAFSARPDRSEVGHPSASYSRDVEARRSEAASFSSSDTDSDWEKDKKGRKGRKGQSDLWRRKMRTHHMAIDLNKDGVVSWEDFEVLINKFEKLGNFTPEETKSFTTALQKVWEEGWGAASDPYAFIGQEQFLSNMEHVVNTKDLRKKISLPLPYFFEAVDWDDSGDISIKEFTTFFQCLGLSTQSAELTFRAIDVNGDGRISKKEFVNMGREFFLCEDESHPSKLFWGPLSD